MIFLDMDGVLADLHYSLFTAWKDLSRGYNLYPYPYTDGYNGPTDPRFTAWLTSYNPWNTGPILTPEFWRDIVPFPWTDSINLAFPHAKILSNPGRRAFSHAACHGKHLWCDRILKKEPKNIILAAAKHLLAGPGRVLIDDDEGNIAKWVREGGIGILFPQPWNSAYMHRSRDPLPYIKQKLSDYGYYDAKHQT